MSSPIALGYADSVTLAAGQLLRVTGGGFITHGNPTRQSLFRGAAVFGPFEAVQVIYITASQSPVSYGTYSAEGAWLGSFASLAELQGAFPSPAIGDYATLINGSDVPTIYRFGTSGWVASAGGGGGGGDVSSVNGKTGTVVLNKADISLGNVDNTADADKPVSTAASAAIAGRVPVARTITINGTAYDLTADRSWTISAGTGDVAGPSSAVDSELVLFSGTSGKLVKRATGDGDVQVASGVVTITPGWASEATVASASTTSIGSASSRFVQVTGTTTITSFGANTAGTLRMVRFAGALSVTHNATSLISPTGANISVGAGDALILQGLGSSNWRVLAWLDASLASDLAAKAPLASPALTGTPTAPTASAGTNTTQIATMAAIVNERSASKTLTNTTLTAPTITSPTITATDTSTSGSTPNSSLTVTYTPSGATTKQQSSFNIQTNYSGTNAVSPGGWVVSAQANNTFNSNAAIDKSVVYTAYTAGVGGVQIDKALGFEAVMSGLDATSNINQYASFYSANLSAVPNINRVNVFYAFANDWGTASIKNVGRFLKATRVSGGDVLREVGPSVHPGYVTGRYYGPVGAAGITPVAAVATAMYAVPFYCAERTTWTEIGFRVTTSIAGNARVGIYYGDQGKPTDLIVDSGDLSTSTTGAKTKSISVTLEAGLYFLVFHASAGVTINYATLQTARDIMGTSTDNGNETTGYAVQTYGALPSTMPALTYIDQASNMPFVWLRK